MGPYFAPQEAEVGEVEARVLSNTVEKQEQ